MVKFIPYSVILVVPFAELSLPIILWLYPNAVPSFYLFDTAEDKRIEHYEQIQYDSHRFLIDRLTRTTVLTGTADIIIADNEYATLSSANLNISLI